MIFVTVGNATQGFRRLLDAVDALVRNGFFERETIFLQIGNNRGFHSQLYEYKPFLTIEEFQQWMEKADLIIIGSRGRNATQRFHIGSVAASVVNHTPCCVYVVKEPCWT